MSADYLPSLRQQFNAYKSLGERAMEQVPEEALFKSPGTESNSIAVIVQHLAGNMHSRFTDFRTTDGEKPGRNRDGEFEPGLKTRHEVMDCWEQGWRCVFQALDGLTEDHLGLSVTIRGEKHTVLEALNRQLAHYPYHIGQMVFAAKLFADGDWKSLSIPHGQSEAFNRERFGKNSG